VEDVILDDILRGAKKVRCEPIEHLALERDRLGQDMVECRNPVGRDENQAMIVCAIRVTDLTPISLPEIIKLGFYEAVIELGTEGGFCKRHGEGGG
jgi:hypothetical protein